MRAEASQEARTALPGIGHGADDLCPGLALRSWLGLSAVFASEGLGDLPGSSDARPQYVT